MTGLGVSCAVAGESGEASWLATCCLTDLLEPVRTCWNDCIRMVDHERRNTVICIQTRAVALL